MIRPYQQTDPSSGQGSCRLCLGDKDLKNSHIVPEAWYREIKGSAKKMQVVSSLPEGRDYFEQRGLTEKLLCEACENRFSVWEGYGRQVIFNESGASRKGTRTETSGLGPDSRIRGLNYEWFKLFAMSLLWRMSITTLKYFADVDLGAQREEDLRKMLLDGDPGEPDEYGFAQIILMFDAQTMFNTMYIFDPVEIDGVEIYRLITPGTLWEFFPRKGGVPQSHQARLLQKDGTMPIPVRLASDFAFIVEAIAPMIASGKFKRLEKTL